jgi:hypothetical protein
MQHAPRSFWRSSLHLLGLCLAGVYCTSAVGAPPAPPSAALAPRPAMTGRQASALLRDVVVDVDLVLQCSRSVLVGTRLAGDPPCEVRLARRRDKEGTNVAPVFPINPRGGAGQRIGFVLIPGMGKGKPRDRFIEYQTRIKGHLELLRDRNGPALAWAERLETRTGSLLHAVDAWSEIPGEFLRANVSDEKSWLPHCLRSLNEAVASQDLPGARRWAAEAHAAATHLHDLHEWLDFLVRNHLEVLAFQAHCEDLFLAQDSFTVKAEELPDESGFPGGDLILAYCSNYLEVERQAERLFSLPAEVLAASSAKVPLDVKAVWMPPDLRGAFGQLRGSLSPANQEVWDRAARSRYEQSYLVNMLYRAVRARTLEPMGVVLKRFDRAHPKAAVHELMDVLFYRGGAPFSGFEWADRYLPLLMATSGQLAGDDEKVLTGARDVTAKFFGGWQNYQGGWITLREATREGKLDCVRAADMIGALYRNAGRSGLYSIRWMGGKEGHAVAAAEVRRDGKTALVIVDGLEQSRRGRETWSSDYFVNHRWPTGYTGAASDVYAMSLSVRGLDNYVWVEGYVAKGPQAGRLLRAGIPYLPGREKPLARRITGSPTGGATPTSPRIGRHAVGP